MPPRIAHAVAGPPETTPATTLQGGSEQLKHTPYREDQCRYVPPISQRGSSPAHGGTQLDRVSAVLCASAQLSGQFALAVSVRPQQEPEACGASTSIGGYLARQWVWRTCATPSIASATLRMRTHMSHAGPTRR